MRGDRRTFLICIIIAMLSIAFLLWIR